MSNKLLSELESFKNIWDGGYFEGDCLNPMSKSTYGELGFISTLYATYLVCIKPYVNNNTVSLEIGPGRGAWTKALLPSKEVYALDAKTAEDNSFFEYLGHPKNVKYFQVKDFKCQILPDEHFDYMLSYGCLCHVSFEGIREYAVSIYPKLKSGSNCFWLVADYDKYNKSIDNLNSLSIWNAIMPTARRHLPIKMLLENYMKNNKLKNIPPDKDDLPAPGRWYHAGTEKTCSMLREVGYSIVSPDVGTCLRDPIIHFMKP